MLKDTLQMDVKFQIKSFHVNNGWVLRFVFTTEKKIFSFIIIK